MLEVPMTPDAPPLFSTMTLCPSCCDNTGAMIRATWSTEPPGGKTATNLMGCFVGQACAKTNVGSKLAKSKHRLKLFVPIENEAMVKFLCRHPSASGKSFDAC
jgi:hypothetical protein